jgi:hemin uptake protein HemP
MLSLESEALETPPPPGDQPLPPGQRVVASANLFQGLREICIEHEGVQYRLRITRRNKLILQK